MFLVYHLGKSYEHDYNFQLWHQISLSLKLVLIGRDFSLTNYLFILESEVSPGPGSYNPQNTKAGAISSERKVPSIVIGQRTKWPFKNEAPPPNSYDKPTTVGTGSANVRGAPAWSFTARSDVGGFAYELIHKGNPGPGSYGATEPGIFKTRSSSYSMQARTVCKEYNSAKETPGPGSYDPKLPKQRKGGFTMGVRHSEYVLPLITDPDIM